MIKFFLVFLNIISVGITVIVSCFDYDTKIIYYFYLAFIVVIYNINYTDLSKIIAIMLISLANVTALFHIIPKGPEYILFYPICIITTIIIFYIYLILFNEEINSNINLLNIKTLLKYIKTLLNLRLEFVIIILLGTFLA
jgi:hypothetical protein